MCYGYNFSFVDAEAALKFELTKALSSEKVGFIAYGFDLSGKGFHSLEITVVSEVQTLRS